MLKTKKEEVLKDLEQIIKDAKSIVFVNFHGLKVANESVLRKELRSNNVIYKVCRKSLLKRALTGKANGELPELSGEVSFAYSSDQKDEIAPARGVYNFQKTHKNALSILGGIFEGKFLNNTKMLEVAMIPSREILYAKFVNIINSPIQRLVIGLGQIAKSKS
ncbi:MAG: 50S ribosomal protein L10 [Patescibacteria group bacterium]